MDANCVRRREADVVARFLRNLDGSRELIPASSVAIVEVDTDAMIGASTAATYKAEPGVYGLGYTEQKQDACNID
jgi:hypothetical protein